MGYRWVVVVVCVVAVVVDLAALQMRRYNFLPDEDESAFQVSLRAPQGTTSPATQSILDRIARDVREQIPGVENTLVTPARRRRWRRRPNTGSGQRQARAGRRAQVLASRTDQANARPIRKRKYPKDYVINGFGPFVDRREHRAAAAAVRRSAYFIAGPDIQKLDDYSTKLVESMKQDQTFRDPDRSLQLSSPEVRVIIDRQRAADLGVEAGDVAQALNTLAAGQRVSTFSEGSDQYDVVVRAAEEFRRTRESLKNFTVASSIGGTVGLEKLVRLEEGDSPSSIDRLNRQRAGDGLSEPGAERFRIGRARRRAALRRRLAHGRRITRRGVTGQSKELQRANRSFMFAFLLSFVFMYLILAAQFESFIHPVTILLTLPLSIPFALLSTLIAGQRLNIFSALGILLLFGIVKKNAILQIDHTNTCARTA